MTGKPAAAAAAGGVFAALEAQPQDPLLSLIEAFKRDRRPEKIDVGVGLYRDASGATPVLSAVKAAEQRLWREQPTKAYLGAEGDIVFCDLLKSLIFGPASWGARLTSVQTPGGTGALRLAADLVGLAKPGVRVWMGAPSWPNHAPILAAARLDVRMVPYYDVGGQSLRLQDMLDALESAQPGDAVMLQASCHNPTGADLSEHQWAMIARTVARRGLLPIVDLAYHGLGVDLDTDAQGLHQVLAAADEALVAYSCDKNFGLYRERTGAVFALSKDAAAAAVTQSNLLGLSRANWSMPPDHGAAVVRLILEDDDLRRVWAAELKAMRDRIHETRAMLAAQDPALTPLAAQYGLFATLPLTPTQVDRLRETHAVYCTASGRINVTGLTPSTAPRFIEALKAVRASE